MDFQWIQEIWNLIQLRNILGRIFHEEMLKAKNISCTSHSDNISYCNTFTLNAWTQPLSIKGWIQKCKKKYITGWEIKRKNGPRSHCTYYMWQLTRKFYGSRYCKMRTLYQCVYKVPGRRQKTSICTNVSMVLNNTAPFPKTKE